MYPAGEVLPALPWNGGHGGWGGCSLQDRQVSGELTSWMPGKALLCTPCLPASHNPLLCAVDRVLTACSCAAMISTSIRILPFTISCPRPPSLRSVNNLWMLELGWGASLSLYQGPLSPLLARLLCQRGVCWPAGSRCWLLGPFSWLLRTCLTLSTYWLWLLS